MVPYIHGLSHRIKKVAGNYEVKVVVLAKTKIGGLCALVDQKCEKLKSVQEGLLWC